MSEELVVTKILHFLKIFPGKCVHSHCAPFYFFIIYLNIFRFSGVFMWSGNKFQILRSNGCEFFFPTLNALVFEISQVHTLREKFPNSEFLLVRIFPCSVHIRVNMK